MGGLRGALAGTLAGRGRNQKPELPKYEKLRNPTKERFSTDYSDYSADESDSYLSSRTSSLPSSRSTSGSTPILGQRRPQTVRQKVRRLYPYRLPNRSARGLACILIAGMVIMAVTLLRASQLENERILNGQVHKTPDGPPIWEKFPLLTRYYGGLRTLVPAAENKPEYPSVDEEMPLDRANLTAHVRISGTTPSSGSFAEDYENSVFRTPSDDIQECFLDAEDTVRIPSIRYYSGRPNGFPDSIVGSYKVLSLPGDICLDRFGRYGPYGMGYSARKGGMGRGDEGDTAGASEVWQSVPQVDYRKVDWAQAQRRCYSKNSRRFVPLPERKPEQHGFYIDDLGTPERTSSHTLKTTPSQEGATKSTALGDKEDSSASDNSVPGDIPDGTSADSNSLPAQKRASDKPLLPRTAVVLRCWDNFEWGADATLAVRALISELSFTSGGRYDVHILVHVKDDGKDAVWAEPAEYERVIRERVPQEFRGLVTLWSTTQMLAVYQGIFDLYPKGPDMPVHGAYRGLQMALQHFATRHPEYEYFWHWEMDVRYTGHYLDFFTKTEDWARQQPRKGIWERSARFYVPSVHGSWENFHHLTRVQAETGATDADNIWRGMPGTNRDAQPPGSMPPEKIVWGPERPRDEADWFEPHRDPQPPTRYEADDEEWGVGEEADLISLNPIFDPVGTTWGLTDDITGFNTTTKDGGSKPPRRAHISTASRLSRRLLTTMHRETALRKHFAFTEMWPATVALHHGLKAVYAPHPVYSDRAWPPRLLAQTFNGGRNGASGGAKLSVFGDREHNLHGLGWFYRSRFAPELYGAWLGLGNKWGAGTADFERKSSSSSVDDDGGSAVAVEHLRGGEGRMCLPPMLLHPIKDAFIPVEAPPPDVMLEAEGGGGSSEFDAAS